MKVYRICLPLLCLLTATPSLASLKAGPPQDRPPSRRVPHPLQQEFFLDPESRIVGGRDTSSGRYPYMVSLVDRELLHKCGGTLIAPDIVLTAAHCQLAVLEYAVIGRYNTTTPIDDNANIETIRVTGEYVHPLYKLDGFRWDQMLLKLEQVSSFPVLSVNNDSNIPNAAGQDLTILGFGSTREGHADFPGVLQQASIQTIPNDICDTAKDAVSGGIYFGKITDDMLCGYAEGKDGCQGDSGGPLIVIGDSFESDILVGVVSWGFGCAREGFPGVYSRTSADVDWLRRVVCVLSGESAPSDFQCKVGETFSPAPTLDPQDFATPIMSGQVPILFYLILDGFPDEVSWSIVEEKTGEIVHSVETGTYRTEDEVSETVVLQNGQTYLFRIRDEFGDGLEGGKTGYTIIYGTVLNGQVLAEGDGKYGYGEDISFQAPQIIGGMLVPEGQIPLTVEIQLDENSRDTGFTIEKLFLTVDTVAYVQPGIFLVPHDRIVRTYILEEGALHNFQMVDAFGDGIKGGFVRLFLGTDNTTDTGSMIHERDGAYGTGFDFAFVATLGAVATPPPLPPSQNSEDYLTLELYMDLFPEEISVALSLPTSSNQNLEDTVLFFRPPRYYKGLASQKVVERIPLPTLFGITQVFTVVIHDSHGDGLCCDWNGNADSTGYKIWVGEAGTGFEIISSEFAGRHREVTTFAYPIISDQLPEASAPPDPLPNTPVQGTQITLALRLDLFPEEIGVVISNHESKETVFLRQPGAYGDKHGEVVVEEIVLPNGIYDFEIFDSWGDGIAAFTDTDDYGYFLLALGDLDINDYTPIIFGHGDSFESIAFRTFSVMGDSASFPLSLSVTTGSKPDQFGFKILRLDLLETEPQILEIPQGWYLEPYSEAITTVSVVQGGLYSVQLFDYREDGIGEASILVGSTDPHVARVVHIEDFKDFWETTIVAEMSERDQIQWGRTLSLRIIFDEFPEQVSWLLVAEEAGYSIETQRKINGQRVVAFGPEKPYSNDMAGKEVIEKITIPQFSGTQSFTLVLSDSGGDGVCCTEGNGGPVELYDGTVGEGFLLVSDPFEGSERLVKSFEVEGTPKICYVSTRTNLCGPLVKNVEEVEDCDCYNFCDGELVGCCAYGELCGVNCPQIENAVAGCIMETTESTTNLGDLTETEVSSGTEASSWSFILVGCFLIFQFVPFLLEIGFR